MMMIDHPRFDGSMFSRNISETGSAPKENMYSLKKVVGFDSRSIDNLRKRAK
jgi:hypothetical protein